MSRRTRAKILREMILRREPTRAEEIRYAWRTALCYARHLLKRWRIPISCALRGHPTALARVQRRDGMRRTGQRCDCTKVKYWTPWVEDGHLVSDDRPGDA